MDADVKERWVAALRGGGYQQGHGKMRDCQNKFCCLGVLCDILVPGEWVWHDRDQIEYEMRGQVGTLPSSILREVQVGFGEMQDLIELNDKTKASFDAIADWIEENL